MTAVAGPWCGRTFSTTPIIWRNVQPRQPYLDEWQLFFWFLFYNIGIPPLDIGIGTAFLGDRDWICKYSLGGKGIIGEKYELRQTASNYFEG